MAQWMVDGPYFDDLEVGDQVDSAPALTVTSGLAAVHQAVLGDRLRLPLDNQLAAAVCGQPSVVHPALVWDVAIGQSTVVTRRVVANLFYRHVTLHRLPAIGDTLHTATEVVALRGNRPRPDRVPTGLAALRIRCRDQHGRQVLDLWRCAMLPVRVPEVAARRRDDLDAVGDAGAAGAPSGYAAAVAGWDLAQFRRSAPGRHFADLAEGEVWDIGGGDVVSGAPELARLTLNIAAVHHDAQTAGSSRLVYGGHTIGLALAQATRALPNLVTVAGWHDCQHLGPVREGDTLRSVVSVERLDPLPAGGIVHLRSQVRALVPDGAGRDVLDWRFAAVMA